MSGRAVVRPKVLLSLAGTRHRHVRTEGLDCRLELLVISGFQGRCRVGLQRWIEEVRFVGMGVADEVEDDSTIVLCVGLRAS